MSKNVDYNLALERIEKYKALLLEDAEEFYCVTISDETHINSKPWHDLKKTVMDFKDVESEPYFQ